MIQLFRKQKQSLESIIAAKKKEINSDESEKDKGNKLKMLEDYEKVLALQLMYKNKIIKAKKELVEIKERYSNRKREVDILMTSLERASKASLEKTGDKLEKEVKKLQDGLIAVSDKEIDIKIYNKFVITLTSQAEDFHMRTITADRVNQSEDNMKFLKLKYDVLFMLEQLSTMRKNLHYLLTREGMLEDKGIGDITIKDISSLENDINKFFMISNNIKDIDNNTYERLKERYSDLRSKFDDNGSFIESKFILQIGGRLAKPVKKEILGKLRCIYKIHGSRKEHVKHKGRFIAVTVYKKLMKK